jgi:gamma-glutamylcyclotransferase (GGCT)/AIG2-like uncharacterized protein YtfP
MKHLLWVYGSLKHGFSRHSLLKNEKYIGTALSAEAYALYEMGSYPVLIDNKHPEGPGSETVIVQGDTPYTWSSIGSKIWGELYEVSDETITVIDKVEKIDQGLFERKEVFLDEFTLYHLPNNKEVFEKLQAKIAQCYFYKKEINSAKRVEFWGQ